MLTPMTQAPALPKPAEKAAAVIEVLAVPATLLYTSVAAHVRETTIEEGLIWKLIFHGLPLS